jgi:hypothetical protein
MEPTEFTVDKKAHILLWNTIVFILYIFIIKILFL